MKTLDINNWADILDMPDENKPIAISRIRRLDKQLASLGYRHTALFLLNTALLIASFFIPFSSALALIMCILLVFDCKNFMDTIHSRHLRKLLSHHITRVRQVVVKELSLGGHKNYILAESDEVEVVAVRVYGSIAVGTGILLIYYDTEEIIALAL